MASQANKSRGTRPESKVSSCRVRREAVSRAKAERSAPEPIMKKSPLVALASRCREAVSNLLMTCLPEASCQSPFSPWGSGIGAPVGVPTPTVMTSMFFLRASSARETGVSTVSSPSLRMTRAFALSGALRVKVAMAQRKSWSKLVPPLPAQSRFTCSNASRRAVWSWVSGTTRSASPEKTISPILSPGSASMSS